jgi:hypothetical protein
MEAKQRVQHRQSSVVTPIASWLPFAHETAPFMDDGLGRVGFRGEISRRRLRRHHGERKPPPRASLGMLPGGDVQGFFWLVSCFRLTFVRAG